MISVRKNPNFGNWFQVFAFGKMVDEIGNKAKALRFANKLAKESKQTHVNQFGRVVAVD